jgi:hypothetical protein
MSSYEMKPEEISIFPNTDRVAGSQQPQWKGNAMTTCPHCGHTEKFDVAMWVKYSEKLKSNYVAGKIKKHIPKDAVIVEADPFNDPPPASQSLTPSHPDDGPGPLDEPINDLPF